MVTNKPVCVTGASGYIASHIVRELLEAGYTVRGTVRGLGNGKAYPELTSLPGADDRLELVQADLLDEGSFDNAVAGCEYVIHTASPFFLETRDAQRDLVEPALRGTLNVLRACAGAGTVKKVVQTSSGAAIYSTIRSDHTYSEKDWNRDSTPKRNPYLYSKTVAEEAAWEFMNNENPGFTLAVINPGWVIGPSLIPSLNTSANGIRDAMIGKAPAVISWDGEVVDVRDVAHAHVLAMENDKAHGRYLCIAENWALADVIQLMRENGFDQYKLPTLRMDGPIGIALTKVLLFAQPKGMRQYLLGQVGRRKRMDTTKIRQELGMQFRPARETILAAAADLVKWGHV